MRKTEREIKDRAALDDIIRGSQVCRLGLVDDGLAYIVPLCFGYDGACLYFHSAPEGRKLDLLRRNPRVCVEFDAVDSLVPAATACGWTIRYRSVIGTGQGDLVEDPAEKRRALDLIMAQYSPGAFTFPETAVARTAIIRVRLDSLAGKQSGDQRPAQGATP